MEISKDTSKVEQIFTKTLEEAWSNDSFKEDLVEDPLKAIYDFTGEQLSFKNGANFVVTDQSDDNTVYFNIPKIPDMNSVELTEEQLEAISAGLSWRSLVAGAAAAGITALVIASAPGIVVVGGAIAAGTAVASFVD